MNSKNLFYRPEIDGLRAISVVSVLLYHAQILIFGKDWFAGGFIGVDIFFVISGYLITRIILSELQSEGKLDLLLFYERRARRILPVLLVVILFSTTLAWKRLLPLDFIEYAESTLASLFFGSNFYFYISTAEYGADDALLQPLLHTWSLGVEEQFYLAFPIITIAAYKFFRKNIFIVLLIISLLSFSFSNLIVAKNPSLKFYLPFSRFWELAVGSMLAYRELRYRVAGDGLGPKVMPMLGLFLIGFSILTFDDKTPHPSLYTLIPISGVALIIGFASRHGLVGRILGCKPCVFLGLMSYSAYLWHFPWFAFSRRGSDEPTNWDKIEWLLITFLLSIVSYYLIEQPFRRQMDRKKFYIAVLFSIFTLSAFSFYVIQSSGVPSASRLGFNVDLIDTVDRPSEFFGKDGSNSCNRPAVSVAGTEWCELGETTAENFDLVILGDSHSISSTITLNKLLSKNSRKALYFGTPGCPPLVDLYAVRGSPHPSLQSSLCQDHVQATLQMAKQRSIGSVLLIARWDYYVDGSHSGHWQKVTTESFAQLDLEQARVEYAAAVLRTREAFAAEGVDLYVLLQVPHQNVSAKRIFEDFLTTEGLDERRRFLEAGKEKFLNRSEHNERQLIANAPWRVPIETPNGGGNYVVLDPAGVFCGEHKCPQYDSETAFYFDDDHASTNGFARLEGVISAAIF